MILTTSAKTSEMTMVMLKRSLRLSSIGLHEQFSRIKLDSGPGPEPSQEYAGSEAMEID